LSLLTFSAHFYPQPLFAHFRLKMRRVTWIWYPVTKICI